MSVPPPALLVHRAIDDHNGSVCPGRRPVRRSDPFRTVAPVGIADAPAKAIVKIVLIIVAVILCLYLIYLLRRPITWLFIAMFIAVALSPR